jgi:hypothetical protein
MCGIAGYIGKKNNEIAREVYELVKKLIMGKDEIFGEFSAALPYSFQVHIFYAGNRSLLRKQIQETPQPVITNEIALATSENIENAPFQLNLLLETYLRRKKASNFKQLKTKTLLLIDLKKKALFAFRGLKWLGMRKINGAYIIGSKPKLWNAKLLKPLSGMEIKINGFRLFKRGI